MSTIATAPKPIAPAVLTMSANTSPVAFPDPFTSGIVREGWVLKKRRKRMQGFARRYFVLHQSGLLSYSFEPGKPSRDQIALPQAAISTARGQKDIHIDSNNATFHIKCLNMEDFDGWMASFRQFVAPPPDARSLGRRSSVGRNTPRLNQAGKAGAVIEEMGLALLELDEAVRVWQQNDLKKRTSIHKMRNDVKPKDTSKEGSKFSFFKKPQHPPPTTTATTSPPAADSDAASYISHSSLSSAPPPSERAQAILATLRAQHNTLARLLPMLGESGVGGGITPVSALGYPLPTTAEEDDQDHQDGSYEQGRPDSAHTTPVTRPHSSAYVHRKRDSIAGSATGSESGSVWFDAPDLEGEGAQEFMLDVTPPEDDAGRADGEGEGHGTKGSNATIIIDDGKSSIYPGDSDASDTDSEKLEVEDVPGGEVVGETQTPVRKGDVGGGVGSKKEKETLKPVVYRTQLPTGPVGDEGSLFAVLKKNVGKDLSSVAFPVTFNEPLTLLQRAAEEVEYFNLLTEAARSQDLVERLCYVAAFAVSSYAHTRHRSSRKGFNPMLAETFEDPRMKFISEKVCHQPVILAYHCEGEGWEHYASSSGKTKFWGKSLEIIPTGTSHVKIGEDHYEWNKPSSFMRNLMMGTKYLEHTGKMTIENTTDKSRCVIDFKEAGYWGASNLVSGSVYTSSSSHKPVATLEGKWDESLSRKINDSHLHVLWKMNPFPNNALEYYGFTPTDSRLRPDVRALEEGELDLAEEEKVRVEELQRKRRREGKDRQPRWFVREGEEWFYKGGYWEEREKGWRDVEPLW
ncbi:uncharacterized protein STEHIDRAFT_123815 [Stereum hirsutum FP-91666 SS1]|uniref:uncharacterized protein n=1 Tax=Stereum hirsutum (strain FP-91666) TaxID=721885 RepID=UPI0004449B7D|nr:uncharacterized protein STEHIDRAFT_123815 [Stereum hirsutum FP-91666 SS1]EIM83378.1 hypothetical protein STEHIDRAFT_123815 [Stereum hirsutum FP-91666 SS1]